MGLMYFFLKDSVSEDGVEVDTSSIKGMRGFKVCGEAWHLLLQAVA